MAGDQFTTAHNSTRPESTTFALLISESRERNTFRFVRIDDWSRSTPDGYRFAGFYHSIDEARRTLSRFKRAEQVPDESVTADRLRAGDWIDDTFGFEEIEFIERDGDHYRWKTHRCQNVSSSGAGDFCRVARSTQPVEAAPIPPRPIQRRAPRVIVRKEKRAKGDNLSPRARFFVLRRDGYRCQLCGATADDGARLEVDHKVPKSRGGSNAPDNLWTLCRTCNGGKSNLPLHTDGMNG